MDKYSELKAFVSVVDMGSFSAASEQLDITKSSISKKVAALEKRLSVKLLNRTTRRLSVTEAGKLYYDKVKKIILDFDEADLIVSKDNQTIKGTLKISAPMTFGNYHLKSIFKEYMQENVNIILTVELTDKRINVVEEGVDLAIRIGVLPDSNLIARQIAPIKRRLYASPGYIKEHGYPKKPEDLASHPMLKHAYMGKSLNCTDKEGNEYNVHTSARGIINNGELLVEAVVGDLGIALLPTYMTQKECQAKTLVQIMSEYSFQEFGLYAVYPQTQYLPFKVRKLIEMLKDAFAEKPYWDVDCDKI